MTWVIKETKQATKFLAKNLINHLDLYISRAIKKAILKEDVNIDIKKMKGEWKGYYRIKQGDLRIILKFDTQNEIVFIHKIGWR
ncbi:type II toxin-antitoxin system RelE/ParE family toxin [candidate division KSB1 bacterium]|nr:type II toxin-antitoxin system RelE/ParE family toxin [candidate division KSB1 bacterium]